MQNCVYSILNSSLNLVACNCAPHFVSVIITHFVSLSHVTVVVLASLQVKQLCHFTCTTVAMLRHVCCLLKNIRSCFECAFPVSGSAVVHARCTFFFFFFFQQALVQSIWW